MKPQIQILIPENRTSEEEVELSPTDISYLNKYFNKDKILVERTFDKRIRNNGSWVGIIQLAEKQLHFCTKLNANFFYMLSYLNDIDAFLYDPDRLVELKEGKLFFDVIARLMINEFKRVFKKGLLKKYVIRRENTKFLKGKLLIKQHIRNNSINQSTFYCQYDNLIIDNTENRSILYAITLLLILVKNTKLKTELKSIQNLLTSEISIVEVNPEEILRIRYNKLNSYYENLLKLSYHIIKKVYSSKISAGKGLCFNFLVDMNEVYESFLTEMLKEIIMEDNLEIVLIPQHNIKTLVKAGKKIKQKPDIILKKNNSEKLIIDIKYKVDKIPNNDFYQIVCYLLALPKAEKGVLLYESISELKENYSLLYRNVNEEIEEEKIIVEYHEAKLSRLLEENYINIGNFEIKVKEYLRKSRLMDVIRSIE